MPEENDPNPYRPPESDDLADRRASGETFAISTIPKRTWRIGWRLLERGQETGLLWVIVVLQLLNSVSGSLPDWMMGKGLFQPTATGTGTAGAEAEMSPSMAAFTFTAIAVSFGFQLLQLSMMRPLHRLYVDGPDAFGNISEACSAALSRFLPMLGVGIMVGLSVLVGICACVVPGLVIALFAGIPIYIVLTTELGVLDSMRGAIDFVKRQWQGYTVGMLALLAPVLVLLVPLIFLLLSPIPTALVYLGITIPISVGLYFGFLGLYCVLEERDRQEYGAAAWEPPDTASEHDTGGQAEPADRNRSPGGGNGVGSDNGTDVER